MSRECYNQPKHESQLILESYSKFQSKRKNTLTEDYFYQLGNQPKNEKDIILDSFPASLPSKKESYFGGFEHALYKRKSLNTSVMEGVGDSDGNFGGMSESYKQPFRHKETTRVEDYSYPYALSKRKPRENYYNSLDENPNKLDSEYSRFDFEREHHNGLTASQRSNNVWTGVV